MINQAVIDVLGGVCCGLIAAALYSVDIVSAPKRKGWLKLPELLRWSIRVTATLMLLRGVGLSMSDTPISGQHIPPFALLTSISLCGTVCGAAYWVVTRHFPDHVWDRLAHAFRAERNDPTLVPLVMSRGDVERAAEGQGIVVLSPQDEQT